MKKILMIATLLLLAVACNKNQKAVTKLDGNWNATSYTVTEDGVTSDLIAFGFGVEMDFDRCKLNNDEFCSMTTTRSLDGSTETEASVYRVTNDGTKLEQKENLEATSIETIDIVELTRSTLRLQWEEDGSTARLTFEQL
ncbi:MAG: hypothetical protein P8I55_07010 [Crocinitomix sp.]|nr:hypothetical protein [Crocinitomix sp.]